MTRIAPTATQATPTLPSASGVAPLDAAAGAAATAATAPAAHAALAPQVMTAAFERLRGASLASPGVAVEHLVGEAVRASLDAQLGAVSARVREQLGGQITQILLDDPGTRLRLERLMGAPS